MKRFKQIAAGSGGRKPPSSYWIKQWLDATTSGTDISTAVDRLSILSAPTIESAALRQSDSYFTGSVANFYSADAASIDDKTKAQFDAKYGSSNGSYNLWIRNRTADIYEWVQYPLAYEWTESEVTKAESYFGGTSGALRDVNGELILAQVSRDDDALNEDYLLNRDAGVLFVS